MGMPFEKADVGNIGQRMQHNLKEYLP
jgi:hypothetical protein